MKRVRTLFAAILLFSSCQTPPKKAETDQAQAPREIDYQALKKHLNLDRSRSQLGFAEAQFDTCMDGFNFPPSSECPKNYFVVINFRLQCRHSTGSVSQALTADDLEPIKSDKVKWALRNLNGTTKTDDGGYGQVEVISPISQRAQRLRLAIGTEFLYIRAGDITRVVTPGTWCD